MRTILLAVLSTLSLTANAALIRVDYSGIVYSTSGDGAGYAFNDPIDGTLLINTDVAPADSNNDTLIGNYGNSSAGSDSGFITGHSPTNGTSQDRVYVQDDYRTLDYYYVQDYEQTSYYNGTGTFGGSTSYLYVFAYDYTLDFISGAGISQEFVLTSADAPLSFGGYVHSDAFAYENYVQTASLGYAYFHLTRLAVGPVSVPEPGTLLLLASGLAAIGFTRLRPAPRH